MSGYDVITNTCPHHTHMRGMLLLHTSAPSDGVASQYMEEGECTLNRVKKYHLVVDGKSFAVIRTQCLDLLPKVQLGRGRRTPPLMWPGYQTPG